MKRSSPKFVTQTDTNRAGVRVRGFNHSDKNPWEPGVFDRHISYPEVFGGIEPSK
jgi:hypothetical protein